MAEYLTTLLLILLALRGGTSAIGMVASLCYRERWTRYVWPTLLGAWAGGILWLR